MNNAQIAEMFEEIADLLEVKGETSFKVQAYRRAARSLEQSAEPAAALHREGRLQSLPNVGESLAKKIGEALDTGRMSFLDNLRKEVPREAHPLMDVPGVGPKLAGKLVNELGIQSVDELEAAAESGHLATLPGVGEKRAASLLSAIRRMKSRPDRIPLGDALEIVGEVEAALSGCSAARRLTPVGSVRRQETTIGDVDFIAVSDDPEAVMDCFIRMPGVAEVIAHGPSKSVVALRNGRQSDLRVVDEKSYGSMLHHFTGSREHNIQLRDYALKRGISINDYGLEYIKTGECVPCADEEEVYRRLGMDWIPPEIRQGSGEIEAALNGRLPDLIRQSDLRGDLHAHTEYSDGRATVREMALAAKAMGYEYLAITDHSQTRKHAGGLSIETLMRQAEEVRRVNDEIEGITLLHGTETDILADGSLDYPDDVLMELDIVVASVHSSLRQERETITERLVKAARHPAVHIIGHPTGRLLCSRDPSDVDMEVLFAACAESGTALEMSGAPARLDLDGIAARRAKDLGVMLSLETDAHRTSHLNGWMPYAVGQARRAWLEPKNVLNALPLSELKEWLRAKRERAALKAS